MIRYCITFKRTTIDGVSRHKFFVYAETKLQARTAFIKAGYSLQDIISIHKMRG
jgi:hypothetical protein